MTSPLNDVLSQQIKEAVTAMLTEQGKDLDAVQMTFQRLVNSTLLNVQDDLQTDYNDCKNSLKELDAKIADHEEELKRLKKEKASVKRKASDVQGAIKRAKKNVPFVPPILENAATQHGGGPA